MMFGGREASDVGDRLRYRQETCQYISRAVKEGLYWWSICDTAIALCMHNKSRDLVPDWSTRHHGRSWHVGAHETSLMQYAE